MRAQESTNAAGSVQADAPVIGAAGDDLPRNRRTADPLALRLLDMTLKGTASEQRYMYRQSARAVGLALNDAATEAVEAIRACQLDRLRARGNGSSIEVSDEVLLREPVPSRNQYRAWLGSQPEWAGWPTEHELLLPFEGRWTRLREVVEGRPVFDVRALGLSGLGNSPEDEALLAGIREWCASEDRDPGFRLELFKRYARAQLRERELAGDEGVDGEGDAEPTAFAVSSNTYINRFGSWAKALKAAGVIEDIPFDVYARLMTTSKNYPTEVLIDALRSAAAWSMERSGRRLTEAGLDKWRQERLRENWSAGVIEPIPGCPAIVSHFGTLVEAFHAAGILDPEEAAEVRARRGIVVSDEVLVAHAHVCAKHHDLGDPIDLRKTHYLRWRRRLMAVLREPIPTAATIFNRMGIASWAEGIEIAASLTPDWELFKQLDDKYSRALRAEAETDDV